MYNQFFRVPFELWEVKRKSNEAQNPSSITVRAPEISNTPANKHAEVCTKRAVCIFSPDNKQNTSKQEDKYPKNRQFTALQIRHGAVVQPPTNTPTDMAQWCSPQPIPPPDTNAPTKNPNKPHTIKTPT